MRKKIIGIILLVLIVFGGYKLFANVSANNVNSNSIQFSYEDIPAYNGDNPYVVVNDNKPYFTSSEIVKDSYIKYGPLDSIKRVTSAMACLDYDSMPSEDDKKGIPKKNGDGWFKPPIKADVMVDILKDRMLGFAGSSVGDRKSVV